MKRLWLLTITLLMSVFMCFNLTGCKGLEQLTSELGISIEGGNFDKGSILNIDKLGITEEQAEEIFETLDELGIGIEDKAKSYIYDIFVTKKDKEVQPDGTVKVTIPAPTDEKAEDYNVYHVKDNGAVESVPSTFKDNKITFETDSFSYYVVVPTYNYVNYTITYTYETIVNVPSEQMGTIKINGEILHSTFQSRKNAGFEYVLTAEPKEGYRFVGWYFAEDKTTITESTYNYVVETKNVKIIPKFEEIITKIEVETLDDIIEYDPALVADIEHISIADFNEKALKLKSGNSGSKKYAVTGILISIRSDGLGYIRDEEGNMLNLSIKRADINELYQTYKLKMGKYISLYGYPKNHNYRPYMISTSAQSFIPDFEIQEVYGTTVNGRKELSYGTDYVVEGVENINIEKPGEYVVTFKLVNNSEIFKKIIVNVIGETLDFSAYANGGTLKLNEENIGPDYFTTFDNGFGSITLTAEGEEGTRFKGWYTAEDDTKLISTDPTYTFEVTEDMYVYADFEYLATGLVLDGLNAGFDTYNDKTEIYLPISDFVYNVDHILVYAIINGEPEWLQSNEYTIDKNGFDGENPVVGDYTLTFTYNENPNIKTTHLIRVFDEENMVSIYVSSDAGGRVIKDKEYDYYNKGENITLTLELRSETDYEFLGWFTMDVTGAMSSEPLSTEKTYTVTLNEHMNIHAKVEPKLTYLNVVGYDIGNPVEINVEKFWLKDRIDEGEIKVYACGALGKQVELLADKYTVDYDGLDLINPVVGTYDITYTSIEDPTLSCLITVVVWEKDYTFTAYSDNGDLGEIFCNGEISFDITNTFIEGTEVSVTALPKENYSFIGWYRVINKETHEEFELITTESTYTVVMAEDVKIVAIFDSPIVNISISGTNIDNFGNNIIEVYQGEKIDLSNITVWATKAFSTEVLDPSLYTVDLGGLNLENAVAGNYIITYTYTENEEITTFINVNVMKNTYYLNVYSEYNSIEYNGELYSFANIFDDVEEGTTITLKAIIENNHFIKEYVFNGWYAINYETGKWELISSDEILTFTMEKNMKIEAVYNFAFDSLKIYGLHKPEIQEAGVTHLHFEENGYWSEEENSYILHGNIDIHADSEYIEDLSMMFENFHIVARKTNGEHRRIYKSDLKFNFEEYKAEEGWYRITISYESITMYVDVFVMPARNY